MDLGSFSGVDQCMYQVIALIVIRNITSYGYIERDKVFMDLTNHIDLVKDSWSIVEKKPELFIDIFYKRLFEDAPYLEALFLRNIDRQSKKIMNMFGESIRMMEHPEQFMHVLSSLGERHIQYGVRHDHYKSMVKALLITLEEILGDEFKDETREAWTVVYEKIASIMKSSVEVSER